MEQICYFCEQVASECICTIATPVRNEPAIRMAQERAQAVYDFDAEFGITTPDFGRYS